MNAILRHVDRECWQGLATTFDDYNYRQTWAFGCACAQRIGAGSEHVAIDQDGRTAGLADVRIKLLPLLRMGIAYITGAPMVREAGRADADRLHVSIQALVREYVDRRHLTLRVLAAPGSPQWNDAQRQVFADLGFQPAMHWPGYRTLLVDITRSETDIRKSLAQKWRNGLNRAERNGLAVRSGTTADLFEEFDHLYRRLLDRKGFHADLHADFYAAVQQDMPESDRFVVSLADHNGQTVAGHVASILGDTAVYVLGATSDDGVRDNSSYLLQWHTIQQARGRGCRWYDLGGIDPEGNPGVYHFKRGLGGVDVSAAGPFERHPAGVRRHIVHGCERLYRSARALRPVTGG